MANTNMNLIFRYCLSNTILRLIILNIAVIFWAFHYYSKIQWEPLLGSERWLLQLDDCIFEVMIDTLLVNIITIIRQIYKRKNIEHSVWDHFIRSLYHILACLELSVGMACVYFSYAPVKCIMIDILIMTFGEDAIVSTFTGEKLYIAFCIIFLLTILVDTFTSYGRRKDSTLLASNGNTNQT